MEHQIHRVESFQTVAPFTLRVHFEDGSFQLIDFRPVLKGELYGPLQDRALFEQMISTRSLSESWSRGVPHPNFFNC